MAAANHFLSDVDSATRKVLRNTKTLNEFVRAHLKVVAKHERLYARLIQEKHLLPKRLQALVVEISSAVSSHLLAALENENLPRGIDTNDRYFVFNLWIGLIHHYIMNPLLFSTGGNVIEERGEEMAKLFLDLIQQQERKGT